MSDHSDRVKHHMILAANACARATVNADEIRAERDRLIVAHVAGGAGIRETARAAGVDPTQVLRILRRARLLTTTESVNACPTQSR